MKIRPASIHIVVSLVLGGMISVVSPAKWLAASFWVSAVLFIVGSLALFEDALPGGFDNPDASEGGPITKGVGAFTFWTQSLGLGALLAAVGVGVQFWGAS